MRRRRVEKRGPPTLKELFTGTTLNGFVEASRVKQFEPPKRVSQFVPSSFHCGDCGRAVSHNKALELYKCREHGIMMRYGLRENMQQIRKLGRELPFLK